VICTLCPVKGLPEIWQTIPHATGHQVSTSGRVRNAATLRLLKPQAHATGYQVVNLGRSCRSQYVHRLVALTFLGPPPADGRAYEVDHLDFNRHHNALTNVRWLTKDINQWRWKYWADEDPEPEHGPPPPP
jgi:hypothetical protein